MREIKVRNPREFADDIQAALRLTDDERLAKYGMALRALRVVWASRRKLQDENAQLRRGGRTLGSIVDRQCRDVLDATGLHHLIDETGDGDWGAVWENLAELGAMAKAARRYAEDAKSAYRALESSRARVAELEAFVADVACHGLRGDMTPSFIATSAGEREAKLLQYLRSLNDHLKASARDFVPDADRPYSAGRPHPAAKVEIVAESVTELDLLRAQDGAQ